MMLVVLLLEQAAKPMILAQEQPLRSLERTKIMLKIT
jgi:hypothetical protein